jgi:hypothetical protein
MAVVGPVAAKLRAFVRERVRKDGAHYTWGNASRLAEHLSVDPGWVTEYTDDPPTNHADIDTAIAICDFYGVSLTDFGRGRVRVIPRPSPPLHPLVQALAEAVETKRVETRYVREMVNTLRGMAGLPDVVSTTEQRRGRKGKAG